MFEIKSIFASGHHPINPSPQSDLSDIPNRFADVLLTQASLLEMVLCGMLVALGWYIHYEGKSAKGERKLNQEKFESLIIRTQDSTIKMASDISNVSARLDNIERELESQKDFIFANLRK